MRRPCGWNGIREDILAADDVRKRVWPIKGAMQEIVKTWLVFHVGWGATRDFEDRNSIKGPLCCCIKNRL